MICVHSNGPGIERLHGNNLVWINDEQSSWRNWHASKEIQIAWIICSKHSNDVLSFVWNQVDWEIIQFLITHYIRDPFHNGLQVFRTNSKNLAVSLLEFLHILSYRNFKTRLQLLIFLTSDFEAMAPISVAHIGPKAPETVKTIPQDSPNHFWRLIGPSKLFPSKLGIVWPIFTWHSGRLGSIML